jgi:glutathione synthase/RimK-type ligase-like ATP-grasp enzyme
VTSQAPAEPANPGKFSAPAKPPSYRPNFVAQLTNAAVELGAGIRWLSGDYIAVVTRGPRAATIVGYHFPLNNAAAAALADDKCATADVLARRAVPHVPHTLMRFDGGGFGLSGFDSGDGPAGEIDRVADLFGFPLVIKPHRGTSGDGVTRVDSPGAMVAAIARLRLRYQALAAAPWTEIASEYRVIVLDDQERLIFEKVSPGPDGEWRNNLRYGSVPVIQVERQLCGALTGIALRVIRALGLRFASVDIVSSGGKLAVLEVNSGVCLERFSAFSVGHFERASAVYADALRACL